ncbi:MAG: biotin/lipoyl-containing protein, partial [Pseudomonadota bacterium]
QMFRLLRQLDIAPDASQRAMAQTIGISLGRLNALLRDATTAGFVKVGDKVQKGQTLMLIEAMKTFNPVEAQIGGTVRQILVTDAQPVEFGEPLMVIS